MSHDYDRQERNLTGGRSVDLVGYKVITLPHGLVRDDARVESVIKVSSHSYRKILLFNFYQLSRQFFTMNKVNLCNAMMHK